jgi:hypothetical protein
MKYGLALLAALLFLFTVCEARLQQSSDENRSPCCDMAQEALRASGSIKAGMTRRELERHWRIDGGVQFRDETRYVFPKCGHIRVDVSFKLAAPTDQIENSPDDTVTRVSKPYLAYPTMD